MSVNQIWAQGRHELWRQNPHETGQYDKVWFEELNVFKQNVSPGLTARKILRSNHESWNAKKFSMFKAKGGLVRTDRKNFCTKKWIVSGFKQGSKI